MRVPTAILPRHPGETLMARSNRLSAGEMVRLLDPASIDHAPIADRMESEDERYQLLRDSIAETGQTSPILVRPHPCEAGRYQVAFGHRRLRAAAALGRPVRAIVKPLSDRELVIAQGQENSARTDLSFIERGRFAQALEDAGHDRATIMESLAIDKTALSRLISVVNRLPSDIVEAVGAAPSAGRDRWLALARAYAQQRLARPVDRLLESEDFLAAPSDTRFDLLYRHLTRGPSQSRKPLSRPWRARDGRTLATVAQDGSTFTLSIDRTVAKNFGDFLLSRMNALYDDYQATQAPRAPFRHSTLR